MINGRLMILIVFSSSLLLIIAISPIFIYESLADWFGSWQKKMFSNICHQSLSRIIHLNEIPMAVCGRCLGIYASLSAGFITILIFKGFFLEKFRYSKEILIISALILFVDHSMQWAEIYKGTNLTRFLTGSGFGLGIVIFIYYKNNI